MTPQEIDALHAAMDGGGPPCPVPDLDLPAAYACAQALHQRRLAAGWQPAGRKIGHTRQELWPALGLQAPSWGWLYAERMGPLWQPELTPTREPKVELELVLHLGTTPPPDADLKALRACVDQIALGLEWVDRPYTAWSFPVPASIAAGGVHQGLSLGPPLPPDAVNWDTLEARLQVDAAVSEGGSALVLGSPLRALERLHKLLQEQGQTGLQAGEWITTGALAPALPVRAGQRLDAQISGLPLLTIYL
ncbi:2-keto-4-pentenoate hydratase [Inhella inkyongensis]|uniref:2-keto-4-pentenoate hydratase n=1 Tax=Inhella inkyongensis TaxID=392593 RepID=A0A840S7F4_9BURK|nr:fumarylacetoacetate hydrolase family protein [Inhella inkyongensis]MBB5206405.1 2-keto-4-pentenoate hydratase [Inhella inkyongensis]